uniref:Uncharacterized protein n=1 Tax=Rhizophora mucronata TaxID=61149 RepID=A0A2P2N8R1_RHIMU
MIDTEGPPTHIDPILVLQRINMVQDPFERLA